MAMTFSYDDGWDRNGQRGSVRKVVASWTSDGSGNASGTTTNINGTLLQAVTDPVDGPTDNYDIVLTDADGADLLSGCVNSLANRDTTDTETVSLALSDGAAAIGAYPAVCGPVTVTVSNAGSAKSGTLTLTYRTT
jgi:hypothetical protein